MTAYLVALGRIHDQERFSRYIQAVVPTLEPFSGALLGVEDPAEVLEGDPPYPRVVLLQFPSKDAARGWKNSAEKTVSEHRLASSEHVLYLIDEFVPPAA